MRVGVDQVRTLGHAIGAEVAKAIAGQADTVELMLTALFAGGHILLEGSPGTAKTLTARCFAEALGLDYGRIQFTPDLMPGDVVGANIYNFQTGEFSLTRGPIFCDLLLADEINRTPPKTQAALLEAMQERQVTFDGVTHRLSPRFMVVATQNPIEHQGVYPLPEAQLDRFLFKHNVPYPELDEERRIVAEHGARTATDDPRSYAIAALTNADELAQATAAVTEVRLVDEVVDYITRLVRATRISADLLVGASPRAGAMLARAARARAALDGRDYVVPDDVKALAIPTLAHRLVLAPAAQIDGRRTETILIDLVDSTAAPR